MNNHTYSTIDGVPRDPFLSRLRHAPLLGGVLPLMGGIMVADGVGVVLPLWTTVVGCVAALCAMLLAMALRCGRWLFRAAFMVLCFAVGLLIVSAHNPLRQATHYTHHLVITAPQQPPCQYFRATLLEEPRLTAKRLKATVEVAAIETDSGWIATTGKALLYLHQDDTALHLHKDDRVVAYGRFSDPPDDWVFDYKQYLRHKYIYQQAFVEAVAVERRGVPSVWERLRWRCIALIEGSNFCDENKGVAAALLLGWKVDIDPQVAQQYRDAGITHMLCVSGLHVGVMAMIVGVCLCFLGRRRWQRVVKGTLQLLAVWLFVVLTGMAPATLRAGIMFSFLIVGDILSARSNSFNTLAASAWLQLMVEPLLLYDLGFQLSYTAVLGIITLGPLLRGLITMPSDDLLEEMSFVKNILWRMLRGLWEWCCISTAAKWATLPITLLHFHQYSLYSLIANIVVVPLAGVLLGSVLLFLLLQSGWLAAWVDWELSCINHLTQWVGGLPYAVLRLPYFNMPRALLLALLLVALAYWLWLFRQGRRYRKKDDPDLDTFDL